MKFKIYVSSFFIVFLSCFLASVFDASAQSKIKVQGTVKTMSGEVLAGASVTVKGTNQTVLTNAKGEFTISVDKGKILIFNYVGYASYAQGINDAATLNIILEDETTVIDEVVVVGYGTQKKSSVTGSVSKLVNTNLDEIATSRLDNALVGKIAGVTIQNVTSEAGADPVIRVRGFSGSSANSAPLVVVDGYPVPDGLSFVNPQDVASIEVLKDAASAAIYGSRAANGVILVTTKSGDYTKPKYTFKTYYGFKDPYKLNPLMTFSQYAEKLYAEAALRENDPSVPAVNKSSITPQERAAYIIENQISGQPTNWQQLGLQDNPAIFNAQIGISGGKKESKYYISANYQKDDGAMKFSDNTRMSVKAKLDGILSKKVTFNINFNPSYIKTNRPTINYTDYFRMYSYVPAYHSDFTAAFVTQNPQWSKLLPGDFAQARHFNGLPYSGLMPDGSMWTSDGNVDPWSTNNNTPLSIAASETRTRGSYRLLGGGDVSYEIMPKLIFKTSVGGYYNYQEDNTFTKRNARQDGAVSTASIGGRHYKDLLWENTLNYSLKKNGHSFTGLLGYTTQQTWIEQSNMVGRDFPTDNFETLNQAAQIDNSQTYTLKDRVGLVSYLGRITYDYKSKYLLSTSFRTDGSSYFAKGQKWGYFPSVSTGWVVSSEPFMEDISVISNLKLRTSYGATGNNRISSFAFQNLLYPSNYDFGGGNGSLSLGLAPNASLLANPAITWERTFESNTGLDLALLNNRYTLTVEYYNSVTDKLLYNQATMSFTGSNEYINNAGKVRNQGVEVELGSTLYKSRNLTWSSSINFSANKNKLLELGGEPFQYNFGERNEVYAAIVGQPAIQFFGYKTDGIWTSDAQIAEAKANGQTSTLSKYFTAGGLKYVDVDGNGIIDTRDRAVIGSPFPDFLWGFNNTVKYKSFDLNVLIQGSQGGKLVNGDAYYNEVRKFNTGYNTTNRWVSELNPGDGKTPYLTNGEDWMLSDYIVEDASYASIRSVILGYALPAKTFKKAGLTGMRVYASADNLLYLMGKSYRGVNPEARSTTSDYASPLINGYQRGAFPLVRTFTFGLDVNF